MKRYFILVLFLWVPLIVLAEPQVTPEKPIIDMHLHAFKGRPDMVEPLTGLVSPATEEALRRETIEALKQYNIVKAVTSGPELDEYKAAAPERIISGFRGGPSYETNVADLRNRITSKPYQAIAEFSPQYAGLAPNDSQLEPYYSVAEELDIPLGIHIGLGPPGAAYIGFSKYRMILSNPLLLEDVLIQHPDLRLYVMHAGWPMLDEMIGLLYAHPQVYVDISVINWALPREEFHAYLRRLVQAGFAERIMFGSDQMFWPQAIGKAIESVESAPFLTPKQKRDIFYNNAVRFLRLDSDVTQ